MKEKLKDWYTSTFPTDELGNELNADKSFEDLFYALDGRQDVYAIIGVRDSLIRERLFAKLAGIMEVDYSYIYEQWQESHINA